MSAEAQGRRIDDDCTWTYIVNSETYYAGGFANEDPSIGIHAHADGGGVKWEFKISERDNSRAARLEMFFDAFAAFTDIPEFFKALADEEPATLVNVREILDRLGADDRTERVAPWQSEVAQ